MNNIADKVYLPRMVGKKELANYFGYASGWYLFTKVESFVNFLKEEGISYEDIKTKNRLSPELTSKIYEKYNIKSL